MTMRKHTAPHHTSIHLRHGFFGAVVSLTFISNIKQICLELRPLPAHTYLNTSSSRPNRRCSVQVDPEVPLTDRDGEATSETDTATSSAPDGPAAEPPIASAEPTTDAPQTTPVTPDDPRHDGSRSERVARIRAALRSGSYPIDLDRLAEKIVEREMPAPAASDPNDDNNS